MEQGVSAGPGPVPAVPPAGARGAVDPHHAGGGGRVRAAGSALLGRQGLDRHAPAGPEGVLARAASLPGHARRHRPQLPRGARVPRPAGGRARGPAGGGLGAGVDRRRPGGRGAGPDPSRNRLQTRTLLDAIAEHKFDAVFGGARRDEEKARAKERVYSFRDEFGQWDPKNQRPELWGLYNGRHQPERAHPGVPPVGLDRARHLAVHRRGADRDPLDLLLPPPAGLPARRDAAGHRALRQPGRGRGDLRGHRPLPHRGRHDLHRGGRVARPPRWPRSSRRSPPPGSPSGAPPGPTTGSARRPWRTASGRATSKWSCCASPPPARSTTARARSSGACSTTPRPSSRTSSRRSSGSAASGATSTPTWPCSPTVCGPSASRASPSTWPTATSPPRAASSSSPTPRATSSTPATWSPGTRPPT